MKKAFTFLFAVACLCFFSGCKDKSVPNASDTSSGNPLSAPADYVGALGKAKKSMEKTLSTVGIDKALQTFYTEQGRFPTNLNELVANRTLSSIPNPPFGMKYDYNSKTGTFKVVPE